MTLFAERLRRDAEELLAKTSEVTRKRSASAAAVHEKERIDAAAQALRRPLHEFADDSIAPYFSTDVGEMFHWEIEFPEIFLADDGSLRSDRGFDAVVGNPPYIRIQMLNRELAKWCRDRYATAFGSFDAYIVFIERSVGLLGPEGRLGFIVPNKFLKLDSGSRLRERLSEARLVEEIIDFADTQIFEGATNYTGVLVLDKRGQDSLAYRKVRPEAGGVPASREIEGAAPEAFETDALDADAWVLVAGGERRLLDQLREGSVRLDEASRQIFQGLITSADPVYILEDRGTRPEGRLVYSKAAEAELLLEPDLLHPLASGAEVERYAFKPLEALLLFPYRRGEDGMRLLSEAELAAMPRTAEYLRAHEGLLRGRERGKMNHDEWYAFSRTQSLDLHDLPKLGVAATVPRLEVSLDPGGAVYFHNVRVNGILEQDGGPSLSLLLALLNSPLLDWVFKLGAAEHANGHFAANKQFIAPLPIRLPDGAVKAELEGLGRELYAATGELLRERHGFRAWLGELVGASTKELAGHTRLDQPDSLEAAEILEILRRNRGKLTLDPSSRAFRDRLALEHERHVEKASALLAEIGSAEATANDAIFDLYGVTAAQRTMVENG